MKTSRKKGRRAEERRAVGRFMEHMMRPATWHPILQRFEDEGEVNAEALGDLVREAWQRFNVPAGHPIRGEMLILAVDTLSTLRAIGMPFPLMPIPALFMKVQGPYLRRAVLYDRCPVN